MASVNTGAPTATEPQREALIVENTFAATASRLSWGAVLAGVALTLAIQLALNLLGAGVGMSLFSPFRAGAAQSATGFGIGAALWWVVSNWLALIAGTFLAARMSNRERDSDGALHGVTVWAVALIATAYLVAGAVGTMTMAAVPQAMQAAAGQSNVAALTARADSPEAIQAEVRRLLIDPQTVDRVALVGTIAAQAGIGRDQAERRLAQFEQDARRTVEATRLALSQTAIWSFVALAIGLIAAYFGGVWGVRSARRRGIEPARTRAVY